MNKQIYEHIEKELLQKIPFLEKKQAKKTKDILNSSYLVYNVKISKVKNLHIEQFEELTQYQKIQICCTLIKNSNISEVVSWALYQLDTLPVKTIIENKNEIIVISYAIENWWHADDLSKLYAKILDYHKLLIKEFQQWAKLGNSWQKRMALTSLLYYSSQRKRPLQADTILAQVKQLLQEDSYYIQKGLGWCLRECYNLYAEKTFEFMRIYVKMISPTAFSTATEKLSQEEKTILKHYRQPHISNPYYFENAR